MRLALATRTNDLCAMSGYADPAPKRLSDEIMAVPAEAMALRKYEIEVLTAPTNVMKAACSRPKIALVTACVLREVVVVFADSSVSRVIVTCDARLSPDRLLVPEVSVVRSQVERAASELGGLLPFRAR